MVAEPVFIPQDFDPDLADIEDLRNIVRVLIENQKVQAKQSIKVTEKYVGKPSPWDGESEAEFKAWSEKFSMFMCTIGDKCWKKSSRSCRSAKMRSWRTFKM